MFYLITANKTNTVFQSPGSVSPRRSKKMAPAPPPAPRTLNTHTTGDFDFSPSANASEIHRSPPKLPNSGSAHLQPSSILIQSVMEADQSANVVSQTTPIFPKLSSSKYFYWTFFKLSFWRVCFFSMKLSTGVTSWWTLNFLKHFLYQLEIEQVIPRRHKYNMSKEEFKYINKL